MKIEMSPGTIRMAEELTRQRAAEHAGAIVMAFNGAAEYAEILQGDPSQAAYARDRIRIYGEARARLEQVFVDLDAALRAASEEAHKPPKFVARYEGDDDLHHLEIVRGRVTFAMTGRVLESWLERPYANRVPFTGEPFEVIAGQVAVLNQDSLALLAIPEPSWLCVVNAGEAAGEPGEDGSAHAYLDVTPTGRDDDRALAAMLSLCGQVCTQDAETRPAADGDERCPKCLEEMGRRAPPPRDLPPGVVPIQKRDRRPR